MKNTKRIKGIFSILPNPCLTKPCLPGLVQALTAEKSIYYLVSDGHFVEESFVWKDCSPMAGESVSVQGLVSERKDVYGQKFRIVEVIAIIRQ